MVQNPKYVLVYFDCMYRAEPARLMFAYAGVDYMDRRIEEFSEWPKLKPSTPAGVLPILYVDGKILPQSQAILRYLARKFDLTGKDNWESAQCDMLCAGAEELYMIMRDYFHENEPTKAKKMRTDMRENNVKPFLTRYAKFFNENGTGYFVGNQLTWTDFVLFHFLTVFIPKFCDIDSFPELVKFTETIQQISQIKEWIEKRPKSDL